MFFDCQQEKLRPTWRFVIFITWTIKMANNELGKALATSAYKANGPSGINAKQLKEKIINAEIEAERRKAGLASTKQVNLLISIYQQLEMEMPDFSELKRKEASKLINEFMNGK